MQRTRWCFISILFLSCLQFMGCDYVDAKLKVWNPSLDSVAFIIPAERNYFPTEAPDTKDPRTNKKLNDSLLDTYAKYVPKDEGFGGVHFLAKNSMTQVMTFNIKWEKLIDEAPTKQLEIYFFPTRVMCSGKYKWREIWDKKMYMNRQCLSEEELNKANWNIYFIKNTKEK